MSSLLQHKGCKGFSKAQPYLQSTALRKQDFFFLRVMLLKVPDTFECLGKLRTSDYRWTEYTLPVLIFRRQKN